MSSQKKKKVFTEITSYNIKTIIYPKLYKKITVILMSITLKDRY